MDKDVLNEGYSWFAHACSKKESVACNQHLGFIAGSEGSFEISNTTGAISVIKSPNQLKKEVYELKVKVGTVAILRLLV